MMTGKHKNKKINRKIAQLHMGESIIVLIIFFIILSLGAVFYARISVEKTAQDKAELKTIDAVKVAQQIAKLPEVICTKEGVTDFDCFDEYKYHAFAEIAGKNNKHFKYYESLFPNIQASVVKIYPEKTEAIVILDTTLKDKENNNKVIATSGQKFFIPITIYNPMEEQSSFGYLELEVYS